MNGSAKIEAGGRPPMRVLIVRVGAMGDVLHALAAVTALRRAHPDWQIDWAIEPHWRDVLVGPDGVGPVVDEVVPVRTREWKKRPLSLATLRDVLALRRKMRAGEYDVCVDMQGLLRSAVIGGMAGARRFTGADRPRERLARFFYGERFARHAVHVVDQGCELLGGATGEPLTAGGVMLPVDAGAELWAEGLVRELVGPGMRGLVVMAPTAGWGAKVWPAERYGEVAQRLGEAGWVTVVNAPAKTPQQNARHAMAAGRAAGETAVRASGGFATAVPCGIAELASLLRRASLFLGGDTGPMHLADGLEVPLVALFGPTDPARTGPCAGCHDASERVRVLRHVESRTDHRRHGVAESGLARITVDEVVIAALDLLERSSGARP